MNFPNIGDLSPDGAAKWRWAVAVCVVLVIFETMSGRGILGGIGAFAYASDTRNNGAKIDKVLTLQIADHIRNLSEDLCKSNGSRSAIERVIDEYQEEYRKLTGYRYPTPECEEST